MSNSNLSVVGSAQGRAAPPSLDGLAEDAVPAEVHAVIELYANQLAKVAFPEIDAASLRRQADELRTEAKAVMRAREALDAALATFAARRATVTETATRAIAYARIYSDAHPDRQALAAAITAVCGAALPAPASPAGSGKRRGRPPKRSAELFDVAGGPAPAGGDPGVRGSEPGLSRS